jgi:hypothetical protein
MAKRQRNQRRSIVSGERISPETCGHGQVSAPPEDAARESAWDAYYRSATRRQALVPHTLYGMLAAAALVLVVWRYLPRMPRYSSFIAGFSTFGAENPERNTFAALLFIIISIAVLILCQTVTLYLERKASPEAVTAIAPLFWIGLMPDALFVGFHVVRQGLWFGWVLLGFGLKAVLLLAVASLAHRGPRLSSDSVRRILELVTTAVILAGGAVLSVTAAVTRIWPTSPPPPVLVPVVAGLTCFALLCAILSMHDTSALESLCARAVFLLQLPLALGVFAVYPANHAVRQSVANPAFLAGFLAAFVVAAWVSLGRRYWAWRKSPATVHGIDQLLAPLCLAALLVLANHEPLAGLPPMNPDDYHFGEVLLPYQQYSQFGSVPFADLNCPHGLWTWLGGAANALFFSGTGETSLSGMDLVNLAAVVCFFLSARLLAPTPFAFAIAYLEPPFNRTLTLVGAALFLVAALVRRRPAGVVALWAACLSLLVVPYVPSSGAPFAIAATVGITLTYWFSERRERDRKWTPQDRRWAIGLAVGFSVTGFLLVRMYVGLGRFLLENSAANTIIHAVEYRESQPPYTIGLLSVPFTFLITYFSMFISGVVFLILMVCYLRRGPNTEDRRQALFLTGASAAFVFAAIPYTTGRLDSGLLRPGYYSLWLIGAIWPVVLYRCRMVRSFAAYCGFILLAGAIYAASVAVPPRSAEKLYQVASMAGQVSIGESRSRRTDLPNVGRAPLDPRQEKELLELRRILQRYVRRGETYFDMTNHSARYFYLGYRVPFIESAVYNAAAEATQRRIVEALRKTPPPIVLIDASNIYHDGGRNSVRVNSIYRYVISHYVPLQEGDYTLMVRPDRLPAEALAAPPVFEFRPCDLNDPNWSHGVFALPGRAGVTDCDGSSTGWIENGDTLEFPKSGKRTVATVNRDQVWVDGPPLDPESDGFPHSTVISSHLRVEATAYDAVNDYRLNLLERTFFMPDLRFLPSTWGHSFRKLKNQLLNPVAVPKAQTAPAGGCAWSGDAIETAGVPCSISLDLSSLNLSGQQASILSFTLDAAPQADRSPAVGFELSWVSDTTFGRETKHVRFLALPGSVLVPLDTHPRWFMSKNVRTLRISVQPSAKLALRDIVFWTKKD